MTSYVRSAAIALLVVLVAGCASRKQIGLQAAIPPYPEPYREALQAEFRALADREAAQNDHMDAKRFMLRAEEAARAVTIKPLPVDAYAIAPEQRAALEDARARLMPLFDGGRARAPQALARAHASYECWLEEAEEGHQPEDIAWCRDRFEAGVVATRRNSGLDADWGLVLPGADGSVGAITFSGKDGDGRLLDQAEAGAFANEGDGARDARLTARELGKFAGPTMANMPEAPALYIVFFESGRFDLGGEDRATLAAVAEDAAGRPAVDVEILGFADRAGDDRSNIRLSERRADAVYRALRELGVPDDAFLVYARGEDAPAVATSDGVPERRNRRVEITVR